MIRSFPKRRRGVAVVELAILLPLLAFLLVIAVDFARVFYFSLTVQNCARNGALWACDTVAVLDSPYKSVEEAALADAGFLSPPPTVSCQTVTDPLGGASHVECTVTYQFSTITNYPLVPSSVSVARTVKMRMIATVPNFPAGSPLPP